MNLFDFCLESDTIEGESGSSNTIDATKFILENELNESNLLKAHKLFAPNADWSGEYRRCNVKVGNHTPVSFKFVQDSMRVWFSRVSKLNSWRTHNTFEDIHPFRDGNGRMGRAIWLKKAIEEGYNYERGFLHHYYYQTLSNQNKRVQNREKGGYPPGFGPNNDYGSGVFDK